jgi:hypothetical protein
MSTTILALGYVHCIQRRIEYLLTAHTEHVYVFPYPLYCPARIIIFQLTKKKNIRIHVARVCIHSTQSVNLAVHFALFSKDSVYSTAHWYWPDLICCKLSVRCDITVYFNAQRELNLGIPNLFIVSFK